MARFTSASLLLLLAALTTSSTAFQLPNISTNRVSTALFDTTKQPPTIPAPEKLSYGEESRKYRRTIYTHDDWVKHRSPDRFIRNLISTGESGIYKNVGREIVWTVGVASFVFGWNMVVGGYEDFEGVKHAAVISNQYLTPLTLPLTPFTLASPSLSLLLGKSSSCLFLHSNETDVPTLFSLPKRPHENYIVCII
jgi:putative membrane protein